MLSCLFIAALRSPAGKWLTFLALLYVMFSLVFVTFSCVVLGQVWNLIVSIPDLCVLPYFDSLVYFRLLDMIHVMTFDFHGSWESELAHNSPLYPRTNQLGDEYYNNVVSTQTYLYVHCDKSSKISNPSFLPKRHRKTQQKRFDQGLLCLLYYDKYWLISGMKRNILSHPVIMPFTIV